MAQQYVAGDNLTISCSLETYSTGESPDLTGATLTIYVTEPNGTQTALAAVLGGTPGVVQAPYVAPAPGVYSAQAQVVFPGGAIQTMLPKRRFIVRSAPA